MFGGDQFGIGGRPWPTGPEGFFAARAGQLFRTHVHVFLLHWHQRIAVRADIRHRHAGILGFGGHHRHLEPQGVGAVPLDDVEGVNAVALAFAHGLAEAVGDFWVNVDLMEWDVAGIVQPANHHSRHPEGDDVARGGKDACGVVFT